jgi:hypothetical protein
MSFVFIENFDGNSMEIQFDKNVDNEVFSINER